MSPLFDLSICIPTYNRSRVTEALVRKALRCALARLEVVVLDNGSTDDTLERLRAIDDPRLAVHSNGTNRGVLFNALNVLDKARGKFGVLLLDKDDVDPQAIGAFTGFLMSQPRLAFGHCPYHLTATSAPTIYRQGSEALLKLGYLGHHPTGYFFELSLLRSIDFTRRFGEFDYVGHFPFDFVFAELAMKGDGAIYGSPIFSPESPDSAAKTKSIGTNAAKEDAFFSPKGRLKTAINFSSHVRTLPISTAEKERLIAMRFFRGLYGATMGYRSIMANDAICGHYHIAPRQVGILEMLRFALTFYRRFKHEVGQQGERRDEPIRIDRSLARFVWQRVGARTSA